jgi:ligand-binding sensor protein
MELELRSHRKEFQKQLLEIFASANSLPIALFESRDDGIERTVSETSFGTLETPYCKAVIAIYGGDEACRQDERTRAKHVMQVGKEQLTLCHAGLYSQAVPIVVDGQTRAALFYG